MTMSVNDMLLSMMRSIDIFKEIPDDKLLELSSDFELWFFKDWTRIIMQWKRPDHIYILKNWELEARKADWFWNKVLWRIMPWEIFWEMSYLKDKDAMATVVAIRDSDIRQIPVASFDKFLKSYPTIMDKVYELMHEREKNNLNPNHFNEDSISLKINL